MLVTWLLVGGVSPGVAHETGVWHVGEEASDTSFVAGPKKDHSFRPLLADPRELTSHASFVQVSMDDTSPGDFFGALVGITNHYPLYLDQDESDGDRFEIGFTAGILSQFNLDEPSDDLLNTDFLVGFPVTYRNDNFSLRMRLMHQSSHLGDEFLLSGEAPDRVNLSLEYVDLLLAYTYRDLRLYGGGAYAFNHHPDDFEPGTWQYGLEYLESSPQGGGFQPLVAANVTQREETDWEVEFTGKAGFRTESWLPGTTYMDVTAEGFNGPLPFGQFFTVDAEYYGLNLTIGL